MQNDVTQVDLEQHIGERPVVLGAYPLALENEQLRKQLKQKEAMVALLTEEMLDAEHRAGLWEQVASYAVRMLDKATLTPKRSEITEYSRKARWRVVKIRKEIG